MGRAIRTLLGLAAATVFCVFFVAVGVRALYFTGALPAGPSRPSTRRCGLSCAATPAPIRAPMKSKPKGRGPENWMVDVRKRLVIDLLAAPAIDSGRQRRIFSARGGLTAEEQSEFKSSEINAFHYAQGISR